MDKDIGPDDHHIIAIGRTSEALTRSSDDDTQPQPAATPGFESAGQQGIDIDVNTRNGLEQLLRDPYCHGMQEIPSAVEERARVLRYLLRELPVQGLERTLSAPSDLNSSHTYSSSNETPDPSTLEAASSIPNDLEPTTTPVDPGSPLFVHLSHGLALTVGSALGSIPPSNGTCLEAYLVPNKAKLTAGARAWSKHSHRSQPSAPTPSSLPTESPTRASEPSTTFTPPPVSNSTSGLEPRDDGPTALSGSLEQLTVGINPDPVPPPGQRKQKTKKKQGESNRDDGWWGTPSGPVPTINERALKLFWKVMDGATWRNLHWLPHQVLVYEVRVPEGYGMRWSQDQSPLPSPPSGTLDQDGGGESEVGRPWIFRGFVEPMMENGHEVGWRHPI